MSNKLYDENAVSDIADAIREKNGTEDTYTIAEMGDAVRAIPSGSDPVLIEKSITANGTYLPSADNADGYSSVSVDVEDNLTKYINNTLIKFRTMVDIPQGILLPGANSVPRVRSNILYWEMPNRTAALDVWGYANLTNLIRFDAGKTVKIDNVSLCYNKIQQLILRKTDAITALHNRDSLGMHADGKIYVPPHLIDAYKTNTNWSYFSNRFMPFYIAETVTEKEAKLVDSTIEAGVMIICDVDESYTIKES